MIEWPENLFFFFFNRFFTESSNRKTKKLLRQWGSVWKSQIGLPELRINYYSSKEQYLNHIFFTLLKKLTSSNYIDQLKCLYIVLEEGKPYHKSFKMERLEQTISRYFYLKGMFFPIFYSTCFHKVLISNFLLSSSRTEGKIENFLI